MSDFENCSYFYGPLKSLSILIQNLAPIDDLDIQLPMFKYRKIMKTDWLFINKIEAYM